jgi:hypothetical protein
MAEATVTGVELNALVGKLATMTTSFTDEECAALAVLVALAGDGLTAGADEVEGFGIVPERNPTFEYGGRLNVGAQGILIGLLKNGTPGLGGISIFGGGGGAG